MGWQLRKNESLPSFHYHYVLIDYLCRVLEGRLRAGSDALEVAFCPLTTLERLALTPGTGQVIQKACDLKNKIFS